MVDIWIVFFRGWYLYTRNILLTIFTVVTVLFFFLYFISVYRSLEWKILLTRHFCFKVRYVNFLVCNLNLHGWLYRVLCWIGTSWVRRLNLYLGKEFEDSFAFIAGFWECWRWWFGEVVVVDCLRWTWWDISRVISRNILCFNRLLYQVKVNHFWCRCLFFELSSRGCKRCNRIDLFSLFVGLLVLGLVLSDECAETRFMIGIMLSTFAISCDIFPWILAIYWSLFMGEEAKLLFLRLSIWWLLSLHRFRSCCFRGSDHRWVRWLLQEIRQNWRRKDEVFWW